MNLILASVGIWAVGALLCLVAGGNRRVANVLGPATVVAGCLPLLVQALTVLVSGHPIAISLPWHIPFGALHVEIDALSAVFAAPILVVSALAAVYGGGYLQGGEQRRALGGHWFFYILLTMSMWLVVAARNALLFLMAWELMALASFFLVMFEGEKPEVRRAGWTYMVATRLGTALLLVMFILLGRPSNSLDFAGFTLAGAAPALSGLVFLMAVVGFGTKAGFIPLHVWLPEAHPAAPSHVSAVMSGVMIKTGVYGLVRMLTFLGAPPAWWGWTLIGVGLTSGILGVLFALAQHDLKRLLAYHSVENIGIIALGLGIGLLGSSYGYPVMAVLGFGGALLHVVNHALFKSLLFLAAGSAIRAAGTREMDRLGGLLKRMPVTGAAFLVGAVAISGLPPLNGFISEFLIYLGAFTGIAGRAVPPAVAGVAALGGLALIGGLASACFTKAFGTVFLGEPRRPHAGRGRESGPAMTVPMVVLAALCVAVALGAPQVVPLLAVATRLLPAGDAAGLDAALYPLALITLVACGLIALALVLALVRARLAARRTAESGTWDCGYAAPTARMQYTASSFAQPLTHQFAPLLGTGQELVEPDGLFPARASLATHAPDLFMTRVYRPLFAAVDWLLAKPRRLQHGRLHLYILYIALALLILMAWKLR